MRAAMTLDARRGDVFPPRGRLYQGLHAAARLRRPRLALWETGFAPCFSIAVFGSQSSGDLSVRHKVGNDYPKTLLVALAADEAPRNTPDRTLPSVSDLLLQAATRLGRVCATAAAMVVNQVVDHSICVAQYSSGHVGVRDMILSTALNIYISRITI